jgi:hypothetical protein
MGGTDHSRMGEHRMSKLQGNGAYDRRQHGSNQNAHGNGLQMHGSNQN